jgi:hypothetical protein
MDGSFLSLSRYPIPSLYFLLFLLGVSTCTQSVFISREDRLASRVLGIMGMGIKGDG